MTFITRISLCFKSIFYSNEVLIENILMKFFYNFLNKTPLQIASQKGNSDVVKLLLEIPKINVNEKSISYDIYLISFQLYSFFLFCSF